MHTDEFGRRTLLKIAGLVVGQSTLSSLGCAAHEAPEPEAGAPVAERDEQLASSPRAMNAIQEENARPGTADWGLTNPATDREVEGYASRTSYNRGEEVVLHINMRDGASPGTPPAEAPRYKVEVFRMGCYGGAGARLVLGPVELPGYAQPMPTRDENNPDYAEFGLVECDWSESYRFSTAFSSDADWVSGIYLARLTIRTILVPRAGKQSFIVFVIRDDARTSDFLFQQSVTTYQAYNNWPGALSGGKSTYPTNSHPFPFETLHDERKAARKVSFNRPYGIRDNPSYEASGAPSSSTRSGASSGAFGVGAGEFLTTLNHTEFCSGRGHEYNFVRFLEEHGYDVTYATNIDVHRSSNLLPKHRAFLSVGHDEYWSSRMRNNVEAARDAGVNIAFFSANTCYWQVRFEPGIGGEERVMVSYKGRFSYSNIPDPYLQDPELTTLKFRDVRHPDNKFHPEHELLGVWFVDEPDTVSGTPVNERTGYFSVNMSLVDVESWVTQGMSFGDGATLGGLVGYEVDTLPEESLRCPGIRTIAESQLQAEGKSDDAKAHMTTHDVPSGATVYAAGTIQWSLGLDNYNADPDKYYDVDERQIDTNLRNKNAIKITHNVLERLRSRNRTDIFAIGRDGDMHWRSRTGGVWRPWQALGGRFISAPAVSSTSVNRLSVFGVGTNAHVFRKSWIDDTWTDWEDIGEPSGNSITSNPAAISHNGLHTDVFVRAGNSSSIWRRTHDGASWSTWQSIDGGFTSGPAVCSWDKGHLVVFAIGLDGALWSKQWVNNAWSDWVYLGKPNINLTPLDLISTPAAVSRGPGKIDVFVRGADNAIWHLAHEGSWQSWTSLGGTVKSGPAVSSWHPNRLTLVAVGQDDKPWFREWDHQGSWTEWGAMDGDLTSSPAAISWYTREWIR